MSNAQKIIHRVQLLLLIAAVIGIGSAAYRQAKIRLAKKEPDQAVIAATPEASAMLPEVPRAIQPKLALQDDMQVARSSYDEKLIQQLSRYRAFLRSVDILITDFLLNKTHDDCMQVLEMPAMPSQVLQIIKTLQQYRPTSSEGVFPKDQRWLSKLIAKSISIDKYPHAKTEERLEIIKNLPILQEYLYSDALLHQFLELQTPELP